MKISSLTNIGASREINQDYLYSSEDPVGRLPNLFVVADGMGGHNAGEFASRYAVETIVDTAQKTEKRDTVAILKECIESANSAIRAHADSHEDMAGMGTTIVATVLNGYNLITANVGDSRLYLAGNELRQITRDHSLVQEMVRMGELDASKARIHPDKNIITRAVGAEKSVEVDLFESILDPGDRILLCSDGLTNMVDDSEILEILNGPGTLEAKTEHLIERANKNGGKDNITVITIDPELER